MKKLPFMTTSIRKERKQLIKQLDEKVDNKNKLNKCNKFCNEDYIPYIYKKINKELKNMGIKSLKKRSPQYEKDKSAFKISECKKRFCNPQCIDFTFMGNKQKQNNFRKTIKNGFSNKYNKNRIETLKKRGALSGCIVEPYYNR
jgi:hypothetical protein